VKAAFEYLGMIVRESVQLLTPEPFDLIVFPPDERVHGGCYDAQNLALLSSLAAHTVFGSRLALVVQAINSPQRSVGVVPGSVGAIALLCGSHQLLVDPPSLHCRSWCTVYTGPHDRLQIIDLDLPPGQILIALLHGAAQSRHLVGMVLPGNRELRSPQPNMVRVSLVRLRCCIPLVPHAALADHVVGWGGKGELQLDVATEALNQDRTVKRVTVHESSVMASQLNRP